MVAVSVVMSVYNRERFVAEAIESVLNQTFEDFEFLIWDDGSTDGSLAIAREYEKQDKRVRVVAAEHAGLSPALQKAIAMTTGEFLGWVDSDDRLGERALERTVAVLREKADVGMVYTDYVVMDEAGRVRGKGKRCQVPYSAEKLLLNFITFHFRLLRRDVYEKVGGVRAEFVYAQDYDLCLRLSEETEVVHLEEE
ncbi:MAG: glycosyltransferase, partial [Cyanobacteria bacterium J06648_11]